VGEIATAFVRIRPNMAGFRSETQSGVRGAFMGVGKIVAGAIGAVAVGEIVKSSVEAASSIQKQLEVIRFEFGRASAGLIHFADTAGIALGDSNRSTDEASARFGLLFKSLGVGQKQAAGMTLGFEKLALSVNAIRGGGAQGAATLLKQIVLAAAGNTRGLKQMGIVVDSTSEKIAAFKLGLTTSMTQALTPAQKTQAIYAIATAHLGQTMALAKAHAGDLANVQARLSAEFMLAKERLGNALLPFMARFVGFLADKLPRATEVLFGVLHDLKSEFVTAFDVVKPLFEPIIRVVRSVVDAFRGGGGITGALDRIRADFTKLSPAAKIAVVALGAVAAAFAAIVITSFPITSIVILGAALAEAYRRSATFRAEIARLGAFFRGTIVPAFHTAVAAVNQFFHSAPVTSTLHDALQKLISVAKSLWQTFKVVFAATAQVFRLYIGIILVIWHHFGNTIMTYIKTTMNVVAATIKGALEIIRGIIDFFTGLLTLNWKKAWKGITEILGGALHAATAVVKGWGHVLVAFFTDLWHTIEKIVLEGIEKVVHLLAKIPTGFTVFGHHFGFTNPFQGWDDSLKNTISNIGKTKKAAVAAAVQTDAAVRRGLAKGGNDPGTQSVAKATGKKIGDAIGQGAADGVAGANTAIQNSVRGAKNNLDKIGQDLSKTITDIQAKLGGAAGALAGSPQGKAFQKLKQLIESGAPSFEIQRARAALSSQLSNVGKTTGTGSVIGTQLANLTAQFNKGQIGYKEFERRLHEILRKDGFTLAQALKKAGPALADQLRAEIRAMSAQAKAIAAVPAKFRGIGGAGGGADIKIIRPLEVIRTEQAHIAVIAQKQRAAQLKATQTTNQILRNFKSVDVGPLPGHGKTPRGRGSRNARQHAKTGGRG
jgi:uncharacterized protein YukE